MHLAEAYQEAHLDRLFDCQGAGTAAHLKQSWQSHPW